MTGRDHRSRRHGRTPRRPDGPARPRVWADDLPGLPPLDGVIAALESFHGVADRSPLEAEQVVSRFLGMLGAGSPPDDDPDEPDHVELLDGVVELCLRHIESGPPRVILDFLWVVDAFDPAWLGWPLRDALAAASVPNRPAWAMDIGQAEVVGAQRVAHETGDGFDVAVMARHRSSPGAHVIAVYVDRTLGGLATDFLVHPDAEEYLRLSGEAPGMAVEELALDTAAATIDDAIDATFGVGVPDAVASGFAAQWALVEHYLDKMPSGAAPLAAPAVAPPERVGEVVDRFLAAPTGMAHGPARSVLVDATEFVRAELGGDPLRWTAPVTNIVAQAWLPLSGHPSEAQADLLAALRGFVPWAHHEQGWGDRYLAEVTEVLDAAASTEPGDAPLAAPGVEILEQAMAEGVDLDDEAALDAFLDRYLDGS